MTEPDYLVMSAAGHGRVAGESRMQRASDDATFEYAALNDQAVLSADTDFGTLLATSRFGTIVFVLLRHANELTPDQQSISRSSTYRPSPTTWTKVQ